MQIEAYILVKEEMDKLQAIADRLQAGSDKMRNEGHRLWLVLKSIRAGGIARISIT